MGRASRRVLGLWTLDDVDGVGSRSPNQGRRPFVDTVAGGEIGGASGHGTHDAR